ncbi:GNAT family N-acetyltransferase [Iamia sp. SCSIO 61187]|uniref:GNAT family N-acetyltransferase n=1 Tax=Iamia sp. SCSIO 61187 TaxID=2722752 RepID=UPI001C62E3CD|nr:GNAT family N-acetyltransferase [Iamia sp. SCSIO 61187]QYG93512.1 GNAT family N-acetyltransferase [Iamia sp. SCSIO 61187]
MPIVKPPTVVVPSGEPPVGRVTLPDGRTAVLSRMRSTDGLRLLRFHETLSPETTYLRFFMIHTQLSPEEVDHFVSVDHHDREAIVATIDDELVAVGRYDRTAGTQAAEVAFLVADAVQGQGLGRALFDALVARAGEEGITAFVADVLPHNTRMLRLFRSTGLPQRRRFEEGVVRVEMDVGGGDGR